MELCPPHPLRSFSAHCGAAAGASGQPPTAPSARPCATAHGPKSCGVRGIFKVKKLSPFSSGLFFKRLPFEIFGPEPGRLHPGELARATAFIWREQHSYIVV